MTHHIKNLPVIFPPRRHTKNINKVTKTMLKWDGSFLGEYPSSIFGLKLSVEKGLSCRFIDTGDFRVKGTFKCPRDTSFPCILDELKSCFGLPKLGTHRIKIGGRTYVLYRSKLSDMRLDKLPRSQLEEIEKEQMQRLIAFRFLLSIPQPLNSSFIYRKSSHRVFSFHEPKSLLGVETVDPTESFIKSWFEEKDFLQTVFSFLPNANKENLSNFLYSLQSNIEKTIQRVDMDYIWLSSYIVEKIAKLAEEIKIPSD